ncbi:Dynein assembly factor 1 axonemal [Fasciolopsis buskii]|uniref:Dynein assembly factor 1 axonemal n=1 Tax=Fasciolopsis buskii TaxID=27845 RepID=A0A8E0S7W4_9TREM|nr:Dynein assembly factor 1 axonemal [Fasciolopsis buski]
MEDVEEAQNVELVEPHAIDTNSIKEDEPDRSAETSQMNDTETKSIDLKLSKTNHIYSDEEQTKQTRPNSDGETDAGYVSVDERVVESEQSISQSGDLTGNVEEKSKPQMDFTLFTSDLKNLPYPPGYSILKRSEVLKEERQRYHREQENESRLPSALRFVKIENLEEYTGLRCLFLEVNGIDRIAGLEQQKEMRSLYMAKNLIRRIENLDHMQHLDTLDVSNNMITKIENLDMLPKFTRLVIAHNKLSELDDLIHLVNCKQLSVLDLQHNQIKDPIVVEEVFAKMPSLTPEVPEEYIEEEIPVDGVTAGAGDLGEMPRMHPREGPLMAARIIEDICDELAVLRQKREAQSHLNGQCSDTNPSESETELEIGNGPEEYHEVSGINGQADEGLVSTGELENNLLDTECENRKEQEEPLMTTDEQSDGEEKTLVEELIVLRPKPDEDQDSEIQSVFSSSKKTSNSSVLQMMPQLLVTNNSNERNFKKTDDEESNSITCISATHSPSVQEVNQIPQGMQKNDVEENLLLSMGENAFLEIDTDVTENLHDNETKTNVEIIHPSEFDGQIKLESESIQVEYGDQSEQYDFARTNDDNYIKDMDPGLFRKILTCAATAGRSDIEELYTAKQIVDESVEPANNLGSDTQSTENKG